MVSNYSKILVTGGAGFIGSHIVDRLLEKDYEVTVIDNLSNGNLDNLSHNNDNKEFHFIKGDIRDTDLLSKILDDIDVVFHEAALVSIKQSIENPLLANDINIVGTLNLLKISADLNVKRFIFASSAALYADTDFPKKAEDTTLNPTTPYSISKLTAENYLQFYYKFYDLESVSFRYFNVYGPRQSFDLSSQYGGVITIFLNRLLRNMSPIIYGDGKQTRDFVYIQDIVEANMLALKNKNAAGEVFNIGSGKRVSVNQVSEVFKLLLHRENVKNTYSAPRAGDARHGYADIQKAKEILGYNPKFSFQEGAKELVDWYIMNSN